MNRKLLSLVFLLLPFVQINYAQTAPNADKNTLTPEMRKDATAFLRETSVEVNSLRTLENRISFSAELATLMWFQDEKEARTMFQTVINDFGQLFVKYNAQISAQTPPNDERNYTSGTSASGEIFKKFTKAAAVRQQIATAIAEHDPQFALEFFNDTAQLITNPELKKQLEGRDSYFESALLQQVAEKDVDTALKFARKSLERGFNYQTVDLLKKIYDKDADKGISFGEDIVAKIKSDQSDPEFFYVTNSLLTLGADNFETAKEKSDKKPIFSEQSLRQIAESLAQNILAREDLGDEDFSDYTSRIEKFLPSRAAQIRQKFKISPKKNETKVVAVENSMQTSAAIPEKAADTSEKLFTPEAAQMSKEEREKLIAEAKNRIAQTEDPNQKIMSLTQLAMQLSRLGDKETAGKIMEESRALINLPPKNYQDFIQIWFLAVGFSQIDADKSFPILEDAIFRLNETIAAFVKVGEFMDVGGEMIDDGEIQVGSFGGEISRELLRNFGETDSAINNLAAADFARTRSLTNKFDRPEVRILAKLLVLRGVLSNKKLKSEKF